MCGTVARAARFVKELFNVMYSSRMTSDGVLRIGELSKRAGVSPELLRAWERRYGLLRPTRSAGGLRLYSPADVERVRLMRQHLAEGLAAAEAAALALRAGVGEEAAPAALVPRRCATSSPTRWTGSTSRGHRRSSTGCWPWRPWTRC